MLTTTFSEAEDMIRLAHGILWEDVSIVDFEFGTFVRTSNEEFRTVKWEEVASLDKRANIRSTYGGY